MSQLGPLLECARGVIDHTIFGAGSAASVAIPILPLPISERSLDVGSSRLLVLTAAYMPGVVRRGMFV
jgi:hypothetical protein